MNIKQKCVIIFSLVFVLVIVIGSCYYFLNKREHHPIIPIVINTWNLENATNTAWEYLSIKNSSALDAIEAGCSTCETERCRGTVGYGGSPDENGETTLDALIIDGSTMNMGAVGGIRYIKSAISIARKVMDNTKHTLLVGNLASDFATYMGFLPESLSTNESIYIWEMWIRNSCQPNFWLNVLPDSNQNCGPYKPNKLFSLIKKEGNNPELNEINHDTISMLAIDKNGNIAAGGSTNGLNHKIPGRVGDTPIPGAGAYAENDIGAASATGDGDIMMRFLPSFLAVEEIRRGASPKDAAETAIKRIKSYFPKFFGAIICINKFGEYGAACNGMKTFPFSVANSLLGKAEVKIINCLKM